MESDERYLEDDPLLSTRWRSRAFCKIPCLSRHSERFDAIAIFLGRLGFIARGFVWTAVGGVAISAAFTGHRAEGAPGALDVVASNTGGAAILAITTLGIFAYALWRFFEGLYGLRFDPNGNGAMNFINGYVVPFCSCAIYCIFGGSNIYSIVRGQRDSDSSNITASIASHIAGQIGMTIAAIILWIVAISWLVQLIQRKFIQQMDPQKLNQVPRIVRFGIYTIGIFGTIGRCILFCLLGVLFVRLAWIIHDKDVGMGEALEQVQEERKGKVGLVMIGFLLIIFGIYSIVLSRFKEFLPYKPKLLPDAFKENVKSKVDKHLPSWLNITPKTSL